MAGGALRFARRVEHPGSIIPERSYLGSALEEMRDEIVAGAGDAAAEALERGMTREAAFSALFAAVSAAYPWGLASRRMKLWSEVPATLRPAFFQLESRAGDLPVGLAGHAEANVRSQAISLFRRPRPDDAGFERDQRRARRDRRGARARGRRPRLAARRLGGAVHDCKIMGVPVRDTGDLDGDGLAVVSVRLVGP